MDFVIFSRRDLSSEEKPNVIKNEVKDLKTNSVSLSYRHSEAA